MVSYPIASVVLRSVWSGAAFLSNSSESSLLEFLVDEGTNRWLRLLHLLPLSLLVLAEPVSKGSHNGQVHYSEKIQS